MLQFLYPRSAQLDILKKTNFLKLDLLVQRLHQLLQIVRILFIQRQVHIFLLDSLAESVLFLTHQPCTFDSFSNFFSYSKTLSSDKLILIVGYSMIAIYLLLWRRTRPDSWSAWIGVGVLVVWVFLGWWGLRLCVPRLWGRGGLVGCVWCVWWGRCCWWCFGVWRGSWAGWGVLYVVEQCDIIGSNLYFGFHQQFTNRYWLNINIITPSSHPN